MGDTVVTTLSRTVQLKPGLILIKLKASAGVEPASFRTILPENGDGSISMLSNPLKEDAVLRENGDCIVLRCTKAMPIQIDVQPADESGKVSGALEIKYLTKARDDQSPAPKPTPRRRPAADARPRPTANACFMAHLANHGDLFFEMGEWIAGPMKSDAIEALMVRADLPGLPKLTLRDCETGQVATAGELLGQRGNNRPLRAIDLWIADTKSPERLQIEALFRKAGHIRQFGERVSLIGADPDDALLGLMISLTSPLRTRSAKNSASRVRIYKGA